MKTKIEESIRNNNSIESRCLYLIGIIKQELMPYFGNLSLEEAENALWDKYFNIHKETNRLIQN